MKKTVRRNEVHFMSMLGETPKLFSRHRTHLKKISKQIGIHRQDYFQNFLYFISEQPPNGKLITFSWLTLYSNDIHSIFTKDRAFSDAKGYPELLAKLRVNGGGLSR